VLQPSQRNGSNSIIKETEKIASSDPLQVRAKSHNVKWVFEAGRTVYNKQEKIIKNYRFVNYIGSGSFGKVYLAQHIFTHQMVAIKVQDKKLIDQNNILKFIKSEKQILAFLETHARQSNRHHPFLVRLIESF
jgi:serine/threonine protein kinase